MPLFLRLFPASSSGLHLLALLCVVMTGTGSVHTATLIVTSTGDSGAGSLRQALADANDGDTIQFDAALNGQTVGLTSGELVIDKNITINGPGPNMLTVSRASDTAPFRIFHVMPGHTVVIEGLTISGGSADGPGHGVLNDQSTLTIDNCSVRNNQGAGSPNGGDGGGIYNNNAILTITNSTIADNFAIIFGGFGSGGGVYNVGTLEIVNSTISGNLAYQNGGGVFSAGSLQITNSMIGSNNAGFYEGSGGGIANDGTAAISGSTVRDNHASAAPNGEGQGFGGGISNGAMLTISNSTVSDNSASGSGGGIGNGGRLAITNSTISGNTAVMGGGIGNGGSSAALEIANTILKAGTQGPNIMNNAGTVTSHGYNLSSDDGGGFFTATGDQINTDPMLGPLQDNGGPTFTHRLLTGSSAIDAGDPNFTPPPLYDQRGPGYARVFNGRIDIGSFEAQPIGTTLTVTTTADSGEGSLRDVIAAAQSGDTIQFSAALNGQIITLTSGELMIDKSVTITGPGVSQLTVRRSTVAGTPAFRIFEVIAGRVVTIQGLTISNGYAPDSNPPFRSGGGIYNSATLTMSNCALIGNRTDYDGGGIYNDYYGTMLTMDNCTVNNNFASGYGGGIYSGGPLTITNCILSGNYGERGGGIYNATTLTLSNSTLGSNTAYYGGGIYDSHGSNTTVTISNSTLSGNIANGKGGGIYDTTGMFLTHSTLSGNSADTGTGGGIYHDSGMFSAAFEIGNTILKAGTLGANIVNNSGTVTSHGYNLSSDEGGGALNGSGDLINTDPMLGPLQDNGGPTFTHELLIGSPAIDRGDPNFTPPPLYDQRGYARVFNGRIDIGSLEVQPAPTPMPTPTGTPTPTTPTPSPTATPAPTAPQALNISTRLRVEAGDRIAIGGFIVTGTESKKVVIRGIGPSLGNSGLSDLLADPTLELRGPDGALLMQNDNWEDDSAQAQQLIALGLALQDPNESGIVATLQPGAYTAIMAGKNQTSGIGLVEIYDADPSATSQLANISTRGFVQTGDNVMIGGFILGRGSASASVAVRGIGPSLSQFGLSNVLADPTLELRDSNGALLIANDNWQDDPVSAGQLTAHGLTPEDPKESGIFTTLPPGAFTAILAGKNGGIGIGLIEVYDSVQ